jgi:hypothetical protein
VDEKDGTAEQQAGGEFQDAAQTAVRLQSYLSSLVPHAIKTREYGIRSFKVLFLPAGEGASLKIESTVLNLYVVARYQNARIFAASGSIVILNPYFSWTLLISMAVPTSTS